MATPPHRSRLVRTLRAACAIATGVGLPLCGGCFAGAILGNVLESYQEVGTHTVPSEYTGLKGKNFAVVVSADRSVDLDYPGVVNILTIKVVERLADPTTDAGAAGFVDPESSLQYVYNHPSWSAKPRSELAKSLGVDRLIVIELREFRAYDAGNQYVWDGYASARVEVFEVDALLPDDPAFTQSIAVRFPEESTPSSALSFQMVTSALVKRVTDRVSWLFYTHEEAIRPKY